MATAKQQVLAYTDLQTEIWTVPAETPKHTLVTQGDRYGVTIANATGVPGETINLGPHSVTFAGQVGVGTEDVTAIAADAVGVALDGTWEFDVTDADTDTTQGAPVYDSDGTLTLTEVGTRIGVVHFTGSYVKAAGVAPVKIGA
ncbi:MAG: hypothetical protein ACTH32_06750 [Microbacterium gubbeenense]|uniref:hypothetical protein n=1 Tax=Microbacterium gubbeenense TaxID=159896 RepID=UPI003F9A4B9D